MGVFEKCTELGGEGGQVCRTCQRKLPWSEFWKQRSRRCGYQSECKGCMRARNNEWHRRNPEKWQERNRVATNEMRRRDTRRALLVSIKARAKEEGREFALCIEDIKIPPHCPVLGIPLQSGLGFARGMGLESRDQAPSVDRIDNTRGYTPDNIVVVSYRANRIKSDASIGELMAIARFYNDYRIGKRMVAGQRYPLCEQAGYSEDDLPTLFPHSKET